MTALGHCSTWSDEDWQDPTNTIIGIKSLIKEIPDFPKVGINFRDIMPVFLMPKALEAIVTLMMSYIKEHFSSAEAIVGLESRGFMFGTPIALRLRLPFIPVRKQGKLPRECIAVSSTKEYGADVIEMQSDALRANQKVVLIDDLLATGGTLKNSCALVKKCGGDVLGCIVVSEIMELRGRENLDYPFHSFIKYYPRGIN